MNQEYRIPLFEAPIDTPPANSLRERYYFDRIKLVQETQDNIKQMRCRVLDTHYVTPSEAIANKFLNPVRRLIGTETKPTELYITENMLTNEEAKLGGSLFRESLPGVDCSFFYTDEGNWFFYQNAQTDQADGYFKTIRYQVSSSRIVKADGARLVPLDIREFNNFVESVDCYHQLVSTKLYKDQ